MTDDPLWYKDAVIYEVPVRAFHDASGSGNGDFAGLTQKLDYLEDLGVTAIWILPFYPSPLKDDGYDISGYTDVNPMYGSLEDFKTFLAEAHRRGLHVITELVINHTSDQHPWFQRARHAPPGSSDRDFYVWSDTADRYANVPLMFPDFESSNWAWDAVAKQYYWHRFYRHQPYLNFDNPAVWEALLPVVDFWMDLGVDGMRLDAVPYLFEREGTACEHLPETHVFLKALRKHVEERYPNRMFLAEANAWPEDAVTYFGDGDECQMAFHFPLMPRLFMALQQEDRFPILDIFAQTPAIPDTAQWCLFLRNHDELTLAMVTDEERDSMFRSYARDQQSRIFLGIRHRLAPLMRNDRRRIELMNALLFSLPGTPVIYYGDEIGMGDNIYLGDRNGVRTPMQWSADRNAGFSRANPQKLYLPIILDPEYHYETVNVESQQNNPSSLLWWMKRWIAIRKQHPALSRGSIEFLRPDNPKLLVYLRKHEGEIILVVANLSRFVQHCELDLQAFEGFSVVELHSHGRFPAVTATPYPVTLGPHSFYWFALSPAVVTTAVQAEGPLPVLTVSGSWLDLATTVRDDFETVLPRLLTTLHPETHRPSILSARIAKSFHMTLDGGDDVLILAIRTETADARSDLVALPLMFVPEDRIEAEKWPALARITGHQSGLLCKASTLRPYGERILSLMATNRRLRDAHGSIVGSRFREFDVSALDPPQFRRDAAGNTITSFGPRLQLNLLRSLEAGLHPDLEVARTLGKVAGLVPLACALEYQSATGETFTLALARVVPPHQGTAWEHAQHLLSQFFERAMAALHDDDKAADFDSLFNDGLMMAQRLGRHLAGIHTALGAPGRDSAFAPELFSRTYQRSIYQTMRTRLEMLVRDLKFSRLTGPDPEALTAFTGMMEALDAQFRLIVTLPLDGARIRCHGDYHLGRLLFTGDAFLLTDFEGEPGNTLGDRRIKRSPLRDLATLLRSLDFAVAATLHGLDDPLGKAPGILREIDQPGLDALAGRWLARISQELIRVYKSEMEATKFLPSREEHVTTLIHCFELERAILELGQDLRRRPAWSFISLNAIERLAAPETPPP